MDLRSQITSCLARLDRQHENGNLKSFQEYCEEVMQVMRTEAELCVRIVCQMFCSEVFQLTRFQSILLLSCLRQTVEEEARNDVHASAFLRSLLCLEHVRESEVRSGVASTVALLLSLNLSISGLFREHFCEMLPGSSEDVKAALLAMMDECVDQIRGDCQVLLLVFPLLDHTSSLIVARATHVLDNIFRTDDDVSRYFLRRALVTGVAAPPNVDIVEDQNFRSPPPSLMPGSALLHLREQEGEEGGANSGIEQFLLRKIPRGFPLIIKAALSLLNTSSPKSLRIATRTLLLFGPGEGAEEVADRLFAAMRGGVTYKLALSSFQVLVQRKEEEEENEADGRRRLARTIRRRFEQLLRSCFLSVHSDVRGWDGTISLHEVMERVEELRSTARSRIEIEHRFFLESLLLVLKNSSWSASKAEAEALAAEMLNLLRHPFAMRNAWLRRLLVQGAAHAGADRAKRSEEEEEEGEERSLQLLLEVVCMRKKNLWRTSRRRPPLPGLLSERVLGADHFLDYLEPREEEKRPVKKQPAGFGFGGGGGGGGGEMEEPEERLGGG